MDDWFINGKLVGKSEGNTFYTKRNEQLHFYRRLEGYPLAVELIDKLLAAGVSLIEIHVYNRKALPPDNIHKPDNGKDRFYRGRLKDYAAQPVFQEKDFEPQKCLPLENLKPIEKATLMDYVGDYDDRI